MTEVAMAKMVNSPSNVKRQTWTSPLQPKSHQATGHATQSCKLAQALGSADVDITTVYLVDNNYNDVYPPPNVKKQKGIVYLDDDIFPQGYEYLSEGDVGIWATPKKDI